MKRPNRYPYTKSQWTEEDYVSYTNMHGEHIALKILKIELQEKQNDLCFDIIRHRRIDYRCYLVNWFYRCNHCGYFM